MENKVESIIFGLKETIAEQKAEIERLTEDKSFAIRKMMESKSKAVELQKQVDELKSRKIEPLIVKCSSLETCPKVEQAVKETAKNIANWLPTTVVEDKNVLSRIIKECYGVEVE